MNSIPLVIAVSGATVKKTKGVHNGMDDLSSNKFVIQNKLNGSLLYHKHHQKGSKWYSGIA